MERKPYTRTSPLLPEDRKTANGTAVKVERELTTLALIEYTRDFGFAPKKESTAIRYVLRKHLMNAGAECAESK